MSAHHLLFLGPAPRGAAQGSILENIGVPEQRQARRSEEAL